MQPTFGPNPTRGIDRILSYLPLAHIAERAIVEMNCPHRIPLHIFFTEGQPTFLTDLIRSRCTLFFSIPRLYIRFQQGVFEKIPEKRLNLLLSIPILGNIIRKKILANLGLAARASSAPAARPSPSTSSSGTSRWASTSPKATA